MKDRCIDAVNRAAGRTLTQAEVKGIEDRIARAKRDMAREDQTAYQNMSQEEQLEGAAKRAANDLKAEAMKKKQRIGRTIEVHDQIANQLQEQRAVLNSKGQPMDAFEALQRVLVPYSDFKNRGENLATLHEAILADYSRRLLDLYDAAGPNFMGLFTNDTGVRALVHELFGKDSSGIVPAEQAAAAKKGAKAWLDVTEAMRKHYNRLGGEIGKLENWRYPQVHDQLAVAKATREVWVNDVKACGLDRKAYVADDGTYMGEKQINELLGKAWESIATGGVNKLDPGKPKGNGMRANRGAEERVLHFADPDGYLKYQQKYGTGDAYTIMMTHVRRQAGDIALLQKWGPNPDLQFQYWKDKLLQEQVTADPTRASEMQAKAIDTENLYNVLSGRTLPVANKHIAALFDTLRSWQIATKLGSSWIGSLADQATMRVTAPLNNISQMRLQRNMLSTMNPLNRSEVKMARLAGLSLETMMQVNNRWGSDQFSTRTANRISAFVMRASGLQAATEARRRAFGVSMMGSIGSTVSRFAKIGDIKSIDNRVLRGSGIDDKTWSIWKKAELENWGAGGDTMLTPESIYRIPDSELQGMGEEPAALRQDAALKLLGMVLDEQNMAVVVPSPKQRAWSAGLQKGTWKGEIMLSLALFKGFPLAVIQRHIGRGVYGMETMAGKASYLAAFIALSTIAGAAAQQITNFVNGRDPQNMLFNNANGAKFWLASLLKGGSLGIYGDFVFNTNTRYGTSPFVIMSGPVLSYLDDLIGLTQGTLMKKAQGQKTQFGPNLIRFLKSNIPLQNLWYTKAVTDRLIFNQLQNLVAPGSIQRAEQNMRQQFNQEYFWHNLDALPSRGPDVGRAFGQGQHP